MPNYRLTLGEDLPSTAPTRLQVKYIYRDGHEQLWWVEPLGPDTDRAVVEVFCAGNLINQQNVSSRVLIAHYPVDPITREFAIRSVMPQAEESLPEQAGSHENLEATNYKVSVLMSQTTAEKLAVGNYSLYGFKAVKGAGGGVPAIWFKTQNFSLTTDILWSESYQAYTSKQEFIGMTKIEASASYDIDLDQTLEVLTDIGTGAVNTDEGTESAISVYNATSTEFTCGVSQLKDGNFLPLCAFPLYGGGTDVIQPIAKVLLIFATPKLDTGTVIFNAFSPGIMIDLTDEQSRTVNYDINGGWNWGGKHWGKSVASKDPLVPLLIDGDSTSLALRQTKARG